MAWATRGDSLIIRCAHGPVDARRRSTLKSWHVATGQIRNGDVGERPLLAGAADTLVLTRGVSHPCRFFRQRQRRLDRFRPALVVHYDGICGPATTGRELLESRAENMLIRAIPCDRRWRATRRALRQTARSTHIPKNFGPLRRVLVAGQASQTDASVVGGWRGTSCRRTGWARDSPGAVNACFRPASAALADATG